MKAILEQTLNPFTDRPKDASCHHPLVASKLRWITIAN
jgi:hypothetical protein